MNAASMTLLLASCIGPRGIAPTSRLEAITIDLGEARFFAGQQPPRRQTRLHHLCVGRTHNPGNDALAAAEAYAGSEVLMSALRFPIPS